MKINEANLRSLIKEMLLSEEVFGAQSFVYHGSPAPPEDFLPMIMDDTFSPGKGAGALYGKGLYTVYNLKGTKTEKGMYGLYIYKFAVNLYGCISFNDDITQLIYGSPLTPAEQGELLGLNPQLIERLNDFSKDAMPQRKSDKTSSSRALAASTYLKGVVKGIIFTGSQDGDVVVLYDANAAVPVAYRVAGQRKGWIPIDREQIRAKISARSGFTWEEEKYELPGDPKLSSDPEKILEKISFLSQLPPEQRVFRGNIDLEKKFYRGDLALPDNLRVTGDLLIQYTNVASLPSNLHVEGNMTPPSFLEQLPPGLIVDGELDLRQSMKLTTLPDDLKVGKIIGGDPVLALSLLDKVKDKPPEERIIPADLSIPVGSQLITLPDNLKILGNLEISDPSITSLPRGLSIEGDLYASHLTSIPGDIRIGRDLMISRCPITQLPDGLRVTRFFAAPKTLQAVPRNLWVGLDLYLSRCTQITSIPSDLTVGGDVHIHDLDPRVIATVDPKIKVNGRFIGYTGPKELIPRGLTNRVKEFIGRDVM